MAHVLLAQELGMGLWHAVLLRRLAQTLVAAGARVTLVIPDPVGARHVLGDADYPVIPAPHYVPPVSQREAFSARTFGDILGASGWHDPTVLASLVAGWQSILSLAKPDLVMVDHAPSARLAWRGQVPLVGVGLGFTTPPSDLPDFPPLTQAPADTFDAGQLLAHANAVLQRGGQKPLQTLPDLFAGAREWVTCLSDLDPYRRWRDRAAIGPLETVASPSIQPRRDRWVAYLSAEVRETGPLLEALAASGPGTAYVRDASQAFKDALRGRGVDISDRPLDLTVELASAALVAHHGGAGTVHQAALSGCPQLLVPRHLEQAHNAQAVARAGAGVVAQAPWRESVAAARTPEISRQASNWAVVASAQVDAGAAETLVADALGLLENSPGH